MTIYCPQCKSENASNGPSKFCNTCGAPLPSTDNVIGTARPPLPPGTMIQQYRVLELRQDGQPQIYSVLDSGHNGQRIRKCTNPKCGTYHSNVSSGPETICTQCGSPLSNEPLQLHMRRCVSAPSDTARALMDRSMAHSHLLLPLDYLLVNNEHYLITPPFSPTPIQIEQQKLLEDSLDLTNALGVLHCGGVSFQGEISKDRLAWENHHLAWNLVENSVSINSAAEDARARDTFAVAKFLYHLLTRTNEFTPQALGIPSVDDVFRAALVERKFASPAAFREALAKSLQPSEQRPMEISVGRLSHVGMERQLNEDSMLALDMNIVRQSQGQPRGLFAVADGMGGHAAGEVASGLIVQTLMEKALKELFAQWAAGSSGLDLQTWVKQAVLAANQAVYTRGKGAGVDMGSTLALAVVDGVAVYLAHVGDSRIYRVNAETIDQLTTDHSLVERLVATGQITREQARTHDQKNVIYRTVGDKLNLEVEQATHTFAPGDWLLLCSDGLSGMVEDAYLQKIILTSTSPQQACEALITAANQAGGEDNITAVVIKFSEVQA